MNTPADNLYDIVQRIQTERMLYGPSEWAEKYRTLSSDVSTMTGKFKYKLTPYLKEIVDTLSPYHPAKIVAVMKGAQIGFTEGVIVNGILWMISNNPGNTLVLSADDVLSKEMIESRLDQGLASCGIQHLIRPNTIRRRNQRTGDTSKSKEYAGGRLFAGGLQSIDKLSRQRSIRYGFFDDWEAAPISDKVAGNLFDLLQQRFAGSAKSMKQFYSSTPETKPSNIEQIYLRGDQRRWLVPCPECGVYIEIKWHHKVNGIDAGVYFEKTDTGELVRESVGYVCQECGKFFKERHKYDMNLNGKWVPTASPSSPGFYSYHVNCLVSAPHMYTWTDYASRWLDIYKDGVERKSKLKVFINQVLGQPWEERTEKINASNLKNNCRSYPIKTIPNKLSNEDGNGNILLLTLACDLNGTVDDARLDYDIWAHSESGSIYSIDQGSIGTYYSGKDVEGRDLWSYKNEARNNVWDYLWNEIINVSYPRDDGGEMFIMCAGIDTGFYTHFAYGFIDTQPGRLIGLKGKVDETFMKADKDVGTYKPARERPNLYILESIKLKDELATMVTAKWSEGNQQPAGFMNFPTPSNNKYSNYYFEQYEAETKVLEENDEGDAIGWRWVKKTSSSQNHYWDTAYYNLAVRDIIVDKILKEMDIKNGTWVDFVNIINKIIK